MVTLTGTLCGNMWQGEREQSTLHLYVWLYCQHMLKTSQPHRHHSCSDPFHGLLDIWTQRNDFTHSVVPSDLWEAALRRLRAPVQERFTRDTWGFGNKRINPLFLFFFLKRKPQSLTGVDQNSRFPLWAEKYQLQFTPVILIQTPLPVHPFSPFKVMSCNDFVLLQAWSRVTRFHTYTDDFTFLVYLGWTKSTNRQRKRRKKGENRKMPLIETQTLSTQNLITVPAAGRKSVAVTTVMILPNSGPQSTTTESQILYLVFTTVPRSC